MHARYQEEAEAVVRTSVKPKCVARRYWSTGKVPRYLGRYLLICKATLLEGQV